MAPDGVRAISAHSCTRNSVWAAERGDLPSDRDLLPYAFDKMSSARYTIDSSGVRTISADASVNPDK